MDERVKLENGKYTFYLEDNGAEVGCLRFGEPWVVFDKGSKAIIALLSHISTLEGELKGINKILGEGGMEIKLLQAREQIQSLEEKLEEVGKTYYPHTKGARLRYTKLLEENESLTAENTRLKEGIEDIINYGFPFPSTKELLEKLIEKKRGI